MKIDFDALRRAGLDVRLVYPEKGPSDAHLPVGMETPTGVEVHVARDGLARKRLRKAVKDAFPMAPGTFVDDSVDNLCDELVAHSIARVCLDEERRQREDEGEVLPPKGGMPKDPGVL